ncbi:cytochrome P450 [Streptomyces nogalater]
MPWEEATLSDLLPLDEARLTTDRARCRRLGATAARIAADGPVATRLADLAGARAEQVRSTGHFDLRADYALPYAVEAACALLGLPAGQCSLFGAFSPAVLLDATVVPPRLPEARALIASTAELTALWPRLAPSLSKTVPEDEAPDLFLLTAVLLVPAVVHLVCEAVAALSHDPGQAGLLRDDPVLAAPAVEETLRHAPPARLFTLHATGPERVADVDLPAGAEVAVVVAAAHRDPSWCPDPDRFDLTRNERHLALPPDLPLGALAPLLRVCATAAVAALAAGLLPLRAVGPPVRRLRAPVTRSVLRFPVAPC